MRVKLLGDMVQPKTIVTRYREQAERAAERNWGVLVKFPQPDPLGELEVAAASVVPTT